MSFKLKYEKNTENCSFSFEDNTDFISVVPSEEITSDEVEIFEDLGTLTSMNQNLLAVLGASHPRLNEIIEILSGYGLHGKLTGAGGGGYAISLVPPSFDESLLENVQKVLRLKGFEVKNVIVGGSGVTVGS